MKQVEKSLKTRTATKNLHLHQQPSSPKLVLHFNSFFNVQNHENSPFFCLSFCFKFDFHCLVMECESFFYRFYLQFHCRWWLDLFTLLYRFFSPLDSCKTFFSRVIFFFFWFLNAFWFEIRKKNSRLKLVKLSGDLILLKFQFSGLNCSQKL